MSKLTLAALDARQTATEADLAEVKAGVAEILATLRAQSVAAAAQEPARTTKAPKAENAEVSDVATKPLTRSAWQAARRLRNGKVRPAFAGKTREQALEAGLLPGFHMPTGEAKEAIREAKAAAAQA